MTTSVDDGDEYVTIIGSTLDELQKRFASLGLGARDFLIMHRIAQHRFIDARSCASDIDQEALYAATYCRRATAV